MTSNVRKRLEELIALHESFYNSGSAGDLLILTLNKEEMQPTDHFEDLWLTRQVSLIIAENRLGHFPRENEVFDIVEKRVKRLRSLWKENGHALFIDDSIPMIWMHFDIGIQTAVMINREPVFMSESDSWWLEPEMSWEEIEKLKFEEDNPWLQLFLHLNRALHHYNDGDYCFLPFWHRSPLDAANGIRGNELFLEMYTDPEQVKKLVTWCVDCEIAIEEFLHRNAPAVHERSCGHMGLWMPERAVWVNGDPVTLISREMMREFEQPYTGKLFTSLGGGFFHNHTKGLYQVDQVAETPGIIVQHFNRDPNCETVQEALLNHPEKRDRILASSLQTPIYIDCLTPEEVFSVLPILREGRFILSFNYPMNQTEREQVVREIREGSGGIGKE